MTEDVSAIDIGARFEHVAEGGGWGSARNVPYRDETC